MVAPEAAVGVPREAPSTVHRLVGERVLLVLDDDVGRSRLSHGCIDRGDEVFDLLRVHDAQCQGIVGRSPRALTGDLAISVRAFGDAHCLLCQAHQTVWAGDLGRADEVSDDPEPALGLGLGDELRWIRWETTGGRGQHDDEEVLRVRVHGDQCSIE